MSRMDDASRAALAAYQGEVTRASPGEGLHLSRKQWRELGGALMSERPKILTRHKPFEFILIRSTYGLLTGWDKRQARHRWSKSPEKARRFYDEGAAARYLERVQTERGCKTALLVKVAGGKEMT